jgi:hypothetical protein
MRQRTLRFGFLSACILALLLAAGVAFAGTGNTTLCHVPSGNLDNAHEILVSESALEAHLQNHPEDFVGTCQARCNAVGGCDDGNACTIDACDPDGTCDNSEPVDCADGEVCTIDVCDPETGCFNPQVPDTDQVECDDGNACSEADVCVAGSCAGNAIPGCCTTDADCPASDACAIRYCEDASSTCQEVDLSSQCTAGACELGFCDPAIGCDTAPVTCPDDGDICTIAQCNPFICGTGGCETIPNPNPPEPGTEVTCDDGLDNDCDGRADATDSDCEPLPCPCFTAAQVEERNDGLNCWDIHFTQNCGGTRTVDTIQITVDVTFLEATFGVDVEEGVTRDLSGCGQGFVRPITLQEFEACRDVIVEVLPPCDSL